MDWGKRRERRECERYEDGIVITISRSTFYTQTYIKYMYTYTCKQGGIRRAFKFNSHIYTHITTYINIIYACLQVAVHDPALVQVVHALRHVHRDLV